MKEAIFAQLKRPVLSKFFKNRYLNPCLLVLNYCFVLQLKVLENKFGQLIKFEDFFVE